MPTSTWLVPGNSKKTIGWEIVFFTLLVGCRFCFLSRAAILTNNVASFNAEEEQLIFTFVAGYHYGLIGGCNSCCRIRRIECVCSSWNYVRCLLRCQDYRDNSNPGDRFRAISGKVPVWNKTTIKFEKSNEVFFLKMDSYTWVINTGSNYSYQNCTVYQKISFHCHYKSAVKFEVIWEAVHF